MIDRKSAPVPLNGASAHDEGCGLLDNPMRSEGGKRAWASQFSREAERRRSVEETRLRRLDEVEVKRFRALKEK